MWCNNIYVCKCYPSHPLPPTTPVMHVFISTSTTFFGISLYWIIPYWDPSVLGLYHIQDSIEWASWRDLLVYWHLPLHWDPSILTSTLFIGTTLYWHLPSFLAVGSIYNDFYPLQWDSAIMIFSPFHSISLYRLLPFFGIVLYWHLPLSLGPLYIDIYPLL